MKKKIVILGSTGSIGINTLKVIESFPDKFEVVGLTAKKNVDLMEKQIAKFNPKIVSLADEEQTKKLKQRIKYQDVQDVIVESGIEGIIKTATYSEADLVVSAIVGAAGLIPTISAIKAKKDIALANKETLVMAGEIVLQEAKENGVSIIPVDSEHSAIFQILNGRGTGDVKNIILTASGGPFLNYSKKELSSVIPAQALKHPNWSMGEKITIDSATLINKGLEIIEARWLFDLASDQIKVVVHPQSIVHSMVEFIDGSVIAQLGPPDMRYPILYALSYPKRFENQFPGLDLTKLSNLTFTEPDLERFPALTLAYKALKYGGTIPCVLNAANEVAVRAFLDEKISFIKISELIDQVMERHNEMDILNIENVLKADQWARQETKKIIQNSGGKY